jgi:predicted transcriptional regulator of viral defense system
VLFFTFIGNGYLLIVNRQICYYLLMTYNELKDAFVTPYFTSLQAQRVFAHEPVGHINTQLMRLFRRGLLVRLKRGVFLFPKAEIDDFAVANLLYPESYVSLESVLNSYGIIPGIPSQITSITPLTTKKINSQRGSFSYSKINSNLYFGFEFFQSGLMYYRVAEPEKAVLDFIYVRNIKSLAGERMDLSGLDMKKLQRYAREFPLWVRKVCDQINSI